MDSLDSQHKLECLRACLEEARAAIDKKDAIIVEMEAERTKSASEFENLRESYELLLADHHRLSKLNHELEARLLENVSLDVTYPSVSLILDSQHKLECLRACLEEARAAIDKKDAIIVEMEAERTKSASEFENLRESYELLLADHHRLSKLNHELEARLLENDRYKEDCAIAVNLLHTNPDQFLPQTSKIELKNAEIKAISDELQTVKSRLQEHEKVLSCVSAERDRYKEDCAIAVNLLHTNPDQFLPQTSKLLSNLNKPGVKDAIPVRGDCEQPSSFFQFPAFLPTFPPVGLSSMMQMNSSVDKLRHSQFTSPNSLSESDHSTINGSSTRAGGLHQMTLQKSTITDI
ncbi:hypothetical protein AHF37_01470 [Paragonimus kellicotti]|nr:hypothetical protein AHF37_01470 [Paragonimus kellicotti]